MCLTIELIDELWSVRESDIYDDVESSGGTRRYREEVVEKLHQIDPEFADELVHTINVLATNDGLDHGACFCSGQTFNYQRQDDPEQPVMLTDAQRILMAALLGTLADSESQPGSLAHVLDGIVSRLQAGSNVADIPAV